MEGHTPTVKLLGGRYPFKPACACGWKHACGYVAEHAALAMAEGHVEQLRLEHARKQPPITDCPDCGAEGAIEAVLRIDLDDVQVAGDEVIDFTPTTSADDPDNGVVASEPVCRVSCRECGYEIEAYVPNELLARWAYTHTPTYTGASK